MLSTAYCPRVSYFSSARIVSITTATNSCSSRHRHCRRGLFFACASVCVCQFLRVGHSAIAIARLHKIARTKVNHSCRVAWRRRRRRACLSSSSSPLLECTRARKDIIKIFPFLSSQAGARWLLDGVSRRPRATVPKKNIIPTRSADRCALHIVAGHV